MLRILRKTVSVAQTGGSSPAERYDDVDDDLSTWEFINASESDDEDLYSFDGDDVIEAEAVSKPVQDEDASEPRDLGTLDDIISFRSLSVSPPMTFPVEMTRNHVFYGDGYGCDDEEEDLHDVDDVDDELVPWTLKDKIGRQRIRKLGKKGGPKLNKARRLPYYQTRPGCLYGKHGFGVQHSFI